VVSFTPIINAALDHKLTGLLDVLLERNDISRIEKIEALELAGAAILSDIEYASLFPKAFDYWRKSLHLRSRNTDGCGTIIKKLPENLMKTGRIVEWVTAEELESAIQNHSVHEIQSFLVLLRILSDRGWDAVKSICADNIHDGILRICLLKFKGRYVEWLHIKWSVLETIRRFHPREEGLWATTLILIGDLLWTLSKLGRFHNPLLNANTIEISLALILATNQYHFDMSEPVEKSHIESRNHHRFVMLEFIEMLANQPHLINENGMELLSKLVSINSKWRDGPGIPGLLLLHSACILGRSLATVDLLVRAGADPNAGDKINGNGPLHFLAIFKPNDNARAQLLMDHGAHLDRVNNEGKTVAEVWMQSHAKKSSMPSWLLEDSALRLVCRCARVIRSHRIPCAQLPPVLRNFLKLH